MGKTKAQLQAELKALQAKLDSDESTNQFPNEINFGGRLMKDPATRETHSTGNKFLSLRVANNKPNGQATIIDVLVFGDHMREFDGVGKGSQVKLHGSIDTRDFRDETTGAFLERRTTVIVGDQFGSIEVVKAKPVSAAPAPARAAAKRGKAKSAPAPEPESDDSTLAPE